MTFALVVGLAVPAVAAAVDTGFRTTVGAAAVADGSGVGIAVIDTGIRTTSVFGGRVRPGQDFTGEGNTDDGFGHGTFVAGIAAGSTYGVAPAAHVVPIRIGDDNGNLVLGDLLDGLAYVRDHHALLDVDVVVMAVAVQLDEDQRAVVHRLVDEITEAGLLVVAAAGNTSGGVLSPADAPQALSVGATDAGQAGLLALSANSGDKPEVAAPGERLVGARAMTSWLDKTYPGARYDGSGFVGTGTSAAAAVVAGAAAVLLQQHPDWTPGQLATALIDTGAALPDTAATTVDVVAANSLVDPAEHERVGAPEPADGTWNGTVWSGNWWAGNWWAGNSWAGNSWAGNSWAGNSWAGNSWAGNSWAGNSWAGNSWAGNSWASGAFAGVSWG